MKNAVLTTDATPGVAVAAVSVASNARSYTGYVHRVVIGAVSVARNARSYMGMRGTQL
jgi:hypothetical protein